MKVIKISRHGIENITPLRIKSSDGKNEYYGFIHGEYGRGRWQVKIPLGIRDFPCNQNSIIKEDQEYRLVDLKKIDKRGNPLYLLGKGEDEGSFLVFWSLSPGFRGGATFSVNGNASLISFGVEAQGMAGRMGGAYCPVILVKGDCELKWHRTGRLYGSEPDWIASYSNGEWKVCPENDCFLEDAIFEY